MKLLTIVEVEDDPHLKHQNYVHKRPLLGLPTIIGLGSSNMGQRIRHKESEGRPVENRSLYLILDVYRGAND